MLMGQCECLPVLDLPSYGKISNRLLSWINMNKLFGALDVLERIDFLLVCCMCGHTFSTTLKLVGLSLPLVHNNSLRRQND